MPFRHLLAALLLAAASTAPLLHAAERPTDPAILYNSGFLDAHPDMRGRVIGFDHFQKGEFEDAMKHFRRGARYGDKPSQGMIGEMYWHGQGTKADRARAHAWMQLAAERGYVVMVEQRDRFWEVMTEHERADANRIHADLLADYGDEVARPRMDQVLRRERGKMTGSRLGSGAGALKIVLNTPNGPRTVDGSQFYHPDFWEPTRYRAFQDLDWRDPPTGVVEVGPIMTGDEAAPPADTPADSQ